MPTQSMYIVETSNGDAHCIMADSIVAAWRSAQRQWPNVIDVTIA